MLERRKRKRKSFIGLDAVTVNVPMPLTLRRAIEVACNESFMGRADYIRRAVVVALKADGIDIEKYRADGRPQKLEDPHER